ncbi:MAG TPA: hypothetical protein VNT32_07910 [Thermoleophilaceae bacterium]|nr:hypothetical protein [Thermoleophilaceae bacterium]
MKDRRGPVGRVGELAAGIAATAARRRQAREPRVLVYDASGHARALTPGDGAHERLLAAGTELIELGLPE